MTSHIGGWSKLRFYGIVAAIIIPPLGLVICADGAAFTRHVQHQYQVQRKDDRAASPGDLIAISGRLRADPVVLPDRFPAFENALMVIKRTQERRRALKRRWRVTESLAWTSERAMIGPWRLDASLIKDARFPSRRASPCNEYEPPLGWSADCSSKYVKYDGEPKRRFSYEVTPIPAGIITVMAVVSDQPATLTSVDDPFAWRSSGVVIREMGVLGAEELLARRLTQQVVWIAVWSLLLVMVAWRFSYAMLCRANHFGRTRNALGGLWRGLLISAPFALLHWPLGAEVFRLAQCGVTLAAAGLATLVWLESRNAHKRVWL